MERCTSLGRADSPGGRPVRWPGRASLEPYLGPRPLALGSRCRAGPGPRRPPLQRETQSHGQCQASPPPPEDVQRATQHLFGGPRSELRAVQRPQGQSSNRLGRCPPRRCGGGHPLHLVVTRPAGVRPKAALVPARPLPSVGPREHPAPAPPPHDAPSAQQAARRRPRLRRSTCLVTSALLIPGAGTCGAHTLPRQPPPAPDVQTPRGPPTPPPLALAGAVMRAHSSPL